MKRLLVLLLMTGCSVQPKYERPAVDLPTAWKESAQNTARDASWWRVFADPVLEKLVEEALARNSNLLLAAARVDEARALLALPFGTFGALAAVWLRGFTNDVYFQIGLVTLLGLAAKNAILIVEYAVMQHHKGLSASAAALEASRLRFRPILMTSLAFILGVLPLAVSTGAGAGARHSVGTGVMGGMIAATFLAIFFVPMFFKLITDRHLTEPRSTAQIRAEVEQAKRAQS